MAKQTKVTLHPSYTAGGDLAHPQGENPEVFRNNTH